MTDSAYTDIQLREWLRSEYECGSSFLRAISEAAFLADMKAYRLLRPVLLKLQEAGGQSLSESPSK